jgi:hypothetical protein
MVKGGYQGEVLKLKEIVMDGRIYDGYMSGKVVYTKPCSTDQTNKSVVISTIGMAPGNYLVVATRNDQLGTKKMVVQ